MIGIHGRGAADLLFFGSTAQHVVRQATCCSQIGTIVTCSIGQPSDAMVQIPAPQWADGAKQHQPAPRRATPPNDGDRAVEHEGAGVEDVSARSGGAFRATKKADLNFVAVGDERYEIPDAVVLGE